MNIEHTTRFPVLCVSDCVQQSDMIECARTPASFFRAAAATQSNLRWKN